MLENPKQAQTRDEAEHATIAEKLKALDAEAGNLAAQVEEADLPWDKIGRCSELVTRIGEAIFAENARHKQQPHPEEHGLLQSRKAEALRDALAEAERKYNELLGRVNQISAKFSNYVSRLKSALNYLPPTARMSKLQEEMEARPLLKHGLYKEKTANRDAFANLRLYIKAFQDELATPISNGSIAPSHTSTAADATRAPLHAIPGAETDMREPALIRTALKATPGFRNKLFAKFAGVNEDQFKEWHSRRGMKFDLQIRRAASRWLEGER